jgi:hypothetical protein
MVYTITKRHLSKSRFVKAIGVFGLRLKRPEKGEALFSKRWIPEVQAGIELTTIFLSQSEHDGLGPNFAHLD